VPEALVPTASESLGVACDGVRGIDSSLSRVGRWAGTHRHDRPICPLRRARVAQGAHHLGEQVGQPRGGGVDVQAEVQVSVVAQHPQRPCLIDQRLGNSQGLLDSPEIAALFPSLMRRAGPVVPATQLNSMVGMALAKSIYAVPTWTRLVALVTKHAAMAPL
jgi:hypothetical protein